jgi:hypothetical protein
MTFYILAILCNQSLFKLDIDEYLPIETLQFCKAQLQNYSVNLEALQGATLLANGERAYKAAYLQL